MRLPQNQFLKSQFRKANRAIWQPWIGPDADDDRGRDRQRNPRSSPATSGRDEGNFRRKNISVSKVKPLYYCMVKVGGGT